MATFTWDADYGASMDKEPRVIAIQFGDGYIQRQAETMNPIKESWSLSFSNRESTEIDDIEEFLTDRGGAENFDWTPPRGSTAYKYICRNWKRTITIGTYDTLTATFERVYET
jgi:phage-related protein